MPLNLPESEAEETLEQLVRYHTVDIWIGSIGATINVCLLTVFFSKRSFFRQNMMLAILAFGDLCACLGVMFVGLSRRSLYSNILRSGVVPVETPWTCSMKAFVWLRLIGSILPSCAVLWIGVERLLAVVTPVFYRDNLRKRKTPPCLAVITYATTLVLLALFLAFTRHHQTAVYYCGRKAAFTNAYSTYIYVTAITGYVLGLILNFVTLVTLGNMYAHRSNLTEINRQLRILRYIVLISLCNTIAVVIPNLFSLFTALYGRMNITISESGSWLMALKSSVNIFIYLALKTDFRNRVFALLRIRRSYASQVSHDESPQCNRRQERLGVENNCHGPSITDSTAAENPLLSQNGHKL